MTASTAPSQSFDFNSSRSETSVEAWLEDAHRQAILRAIAMKPNKELRKDSETVENAILYDTVTPTTPLTDFEAERRFESLFKDLPEERFEDGMESIFSHHLIALVRSYGPFSKDILAGLLEDKTISPEVLSESLRWLGRMDDQQTHEARLWLIERALSSPTPIVRDGAVLGLASLDDPRAAKYLKAAAERESLVELRNDMLEVLNQLTA